MSAKELSRQMLKTIGEEIDLDLEYLIGTPLEKKLIRDIEAYSELQWRLAKAHYEMFGEAKNKH